MLQIPQRSQGQHVATAPTSCLLRREQQPWLSSVLAADFPEKLALFKMGSHQWRGKTQDPVRTACAVPLRAWGVGTCSDYKPRLPNPKLQTLVLSHSAFFIQLKTRRHSVHTQAHTANRMGLSHPWKLRFSCFLRVPWLLAILSQHILSLTIKRRSGSRGQVSTA